MPTKKLKKNKQVSRRTIILSGLIICVSIAIILIINIVWYPLKLFIVQLPKINNYSIQSQQKTPVQSTQTPTPTTKISIDAPDYIKQVTTVISNNKKYKLWLDGKYKSEIWVSNIDETDKQLIFSAPTYSGVGSFQFYTPVWNPDDRQIAYIRAVIVKKDKYAVNERYDVHTINRDGTNDQLLYSNIFSPISAHWKTDLSWTEEGIGGFHSIDN